MPEGLQLFGPDGSLWLDVTDRVGRIVGLATAAGNPAQVSTGMAGMGEPFAFLPNPPFDSWSDSNGNSYGAPAVSDMRFFDNGARLQVQFDMVNTSNPSAQVYWGCF